MMTNNAIPLNVQPLRNKDAPQSEDNENNTSVT